MSVTFYANSIQKIGFAAATEPTIVGETYTCSGGETTGVLYDLVDNRRTNVCTWDTNAQTVLTTVRIDTTTSLTATNCIIDNHNLNTAGAVIDIEQGGTDVTLGTAFSGTLGTALSADSVGSVVTIGADGVTLINFTSAADTQWEVEIGYSGGSFTSDITMGEILLASSFAPSFNPELQPTFGYDMPGSSFRESEGGQRYGFSTHTNDRRSWRMTWKYMSDSDKGLLEDIFLFTRGTRNPFYIDLSGPLGAATPQLFYVRFMSDLKFTGLTKDAWQVTVDIEEEI